MPPKPVSFASPPRPPRRIWAVLAVMAGVLGGIGGYTFQYAEGLSYFSTDPRACVNCHIMQPQYDSWQQSSHHTVARCVDCHLPHKLIPKYLAKADNGYRHSKGFTFQDFHEPIMINARNTRILQENCVECHRPIVEDLVHGASHTEAEVSCMHCHSDVGHGPTTGLGGWDRKQFAERISSK